MKQDYLEKQDIDFLEKIDSVFDAIIFDLDIFVDKKEDNLQDTVQQIEINFKEDVISFEVAPCHLSILSYLISIVTLHKTFFLPLKERCSDPNSCNLENNLDWYNENIKLYNELLQDEKAKAIIEYSIIQPSDDKYEIISDISDLFYIMHILESDENLCSLVVSLSKAIPVIFNKLHISPEEFGEQSPRITKYILYLDYVHNDGSLTTWLIDKSKYLESPFLELATSSLDEIRTLFEEAYSNDNIQIGDNVVLNNGFTELKIRKFELSREKISNIIQNLSCLSLYGVLFLKLEFTFSYLNSKIDSNIIDIYRRFYKIMGKGADILPLRRFYRFAFLYYLTIQGKILGKSSNVDNQITIAKWIPLVYNYSTKHLECNFSMFMDKVDALMNLYDSGEMERKLSNEDFEKVKAIFINPKVYDYFAILGKPGQISVSATPQEICSDSKDVEGICLQNKLYPLILYKRSRLKNQVLIDKVCKQYLYKWFQNKIDDVKYIKYVFFGEGAIMSDKKLVLTKNVNYLVSFLLFLTGGRGSQKLWDYINMYIVNESGEPILKTNPISNKLDNYEYEIRREIYENIGQNNMSEREQKDLE